MTDGSGFLALPAVYKKKAQTHLTETVALRRLHLLLVCALVTQRLVNKGGNATQDSELVDLGSGSSFCSELTMSYWQDLKLFFSRVCVRAVSPVPVKPTILHRLSSDISCLGLSSLRLKATRRCSTTAPFHPAGPGFFFSTERFAAGFCLQSPWQCEVLQVLRSPACLQLLCHQIRLLPQSSVRGLLLLQ